MPNPDPTHPKFLEGDEGLSPVRNDEDVEGHMHAMNHPAEDEAGPEGMKTRNAPDQLGAAVTEDDVEGHLRSFNQPADDEAEPESLVRQAPDELGAAVTGDDPEAFYGRL